MGEKACDRVFGLLNREFPLRARARFVLIAIACEIPDDEEWSIIPRDRLVHMTQFSKRRLKHWINACVEAGELECESLGRGLDRYRLKCYP